MKRFLAILCVVLAGPAMAAADIVITVPSQTVADPLTGGSITVSAAITGSYDVAGFGIRLVITPDPGAVGTVLFTGVAEADNYLFTLQRYGFESTTTFPSSSLYGDDAIRLSAGGQETIADTVRNLITASFSISEGAYGVFNVTLDPVFTGLNGSDAELLDGHSLVGGTITVVPEPMTLGLLAAGGLALAIRRRRTRHSAA